MHFDRQDRSPWSSLYFAALRTVPVTCPALHRPAPFSGALPLGDWGGGIGETRTRIAWVQARRSPLNYDPAGCEGIEPSLRVLEARLVTMTLQPMNGDKCAKRRIAPNSRPASMCN